MNSWPTRVVAKKPQRVFHEISDEQIVQLNSAAVTGSVETLTIEFTRLFDSENVLNLSGQALSGLSAEDLSNILLNGRVVDRIHAAIQVARYRQEVYIKSSNPLQVLEELGQGIQLFELAVDTIKGLLLQYPVLIDPRIHFYSRLEVEISSEPSGHTLLEWISCTPGLRLPTESSEADRVAACRFATNQCLKSACSSINKHGDFASFLLNSDTQFHLDAKRLKLFNILVLGDIFEIQNTRVAASKNRSIKNQLLHLDALSLMQIDELGRVLGSGIVIAADPQLIQCIYGLTGDSVIRSCELVVRKSKLNESFWTRLQRKIHSVVADRMENRFKFRTDAYDFGVSLSESLLHGSIFDAPDLAGRFLLDQVLGFQREEYSAAFVMRAKDEEIINFVEGVCASTQVPKPYAKYARELNEHLEQSIKSNPELVTTRQYSQRVVLAQKLGALSTQLMMNGIIQSAKLVSALDSNPPPPVSIRNRRVL